MREKIVFALLFLSLFLFSGCITIEDSDGDSIPDTIVPTNNDTGDQEEPEDLTEIDLQSDCIQNGGTVITFEGEPKCAKCVGDVWTDFYTNEMLFGWDCSITIPNPEYGSDWIPRWDCPMTCTEAKNLDWKKGLGNSIYAVWIAPGNKCGSFPSFLELLCECGIIEGEHFDWSKTYNCADYIDYDETEIPVTSVPQVYFCNPTELNLVAMSLQGSLEDKEAKFVHACENTVGYLSNILNTTVYHYGTPKIMINRASYVDIICRATSTTSEPYGVQHPILWRVELENDGELKSTYMGDLGATVCYKYKDSSNLYSIIMSIIGG